MRVPCLITDSINGWIVTCFTFSSSRITTCPPRWIIPKTGGFSFSLVPRPRAPLNRFLRPLRSFFYCVRMSFVPRYNIDFITFYLSFKRYRWPFFLYSFTQLLSHFLNIILVQIQFQGNLPVWKIQWHQIQAMHPDFQGLMMSWKDR